MGRALLNAPILDQLDLVVRDMEKSMAFYRLIGLDIPDGAIWSTQSGAHHVMMRMPGGFELALASYALAAVYNAGWRQPRAEERTGQTTSEARPYDAGGRTVMSFRLQDAAAVDAAYERITGAGYRSAQPPYYAFWGSRYAIVVDPDGNHVGLMGPTERAHRGEPPRI